jgi:hypothetical protein
MIIVYVLAGIQRIQLLAIINMLQVVGVVFIVVGGGGGGSSDVVVAFSVFFLRTYYFSVYFVLNLSNITVKFCNVAIVDLKIILHT